MEDNEEEDPPELIDRIVEKVQSTAVQFSGLSKRLETISTNKPKIMKGIKVE